MIITEKLINNPTVKIHMAKSQYIMLPETKGSYQHPALPISQTRERKKRQYSPTRFLYEGEWADQKWADQREILKQCSQVMPPPYLFVEMLNHLRSGKKVHDENGERLSRKTIDGILDEVCGVREPWRGEYLNARFSMKNGNMMISHVVFDSKGMPQEVLEELDPDTLMEDRLPGISLNDWLKRATPQGFPRKRVGRGEVVYTHPEDGRVVGVGADAGRFGVDCDWGSRDSLPAFGVRPVLLAEGESKISRQEAITEKRPTLERVLAIINNPDLNREGMASAVTNLYE